MLTKDLIHWSKEPLREIHSVQQTMLHRKPAGIWFEVGDGPDGWRAWCQAKKCERARNALRDLPQDLASGAAFDSFLTDAWFADSFKFLTEIILKPGARMLIISNAAGIDDITAKYGSDGTRLIDWPAIAKQHQGIIIAPWVSERSFTRRAGWYEMWDCDCGCIWDADAVARLRCSRNLLLPDEVT